MIIAKIRKVRKTEYPRALLFFDCETHQDRQENYEYHSLKLGVCIYVKLDDKANVVYREIYAFDTEQEFWDYAISKTSRSHKLWIFAHNIKYDLACVNVLKFISSRQWKTPYPVISHNFIMHSSKHRRKIVYVDTHNYLKTSLKRIGQKVGLEKKAIDFKTCSYEELRDYCIRDVEIIEKFVVDFIHFLRDNKLGSLKYTIASTSFNAYRTRFLNKEIYYYSTRDSAIVENQPLYIVERKAYKGGRVECFYIGEKAGDFFCLDVNSMYPYVMSNFPMPVKPLVHSCDINLTELKLHMSYGYVIADVVIRDENNIGRIVTKYDDKLLSARGVFNSVLHQPELEYCFERNMIVDIREVIVYQKENIFKEFVDFFYDLKKNAKDDSTKEMTKLILNALYGRFGMRKYKTDRQPNPDNIITSLPFFMLDANGEKRGYYNWFGELCRSYGDDYYPVKDTNLAIAGSVTAYARMTLLKYIELCGYENIYYCDTDSIICNRQGYLNLVPYVDKNKLGYLKFEGWSDYLRINAPKDYIFGDKVRQKGIGLDAQLNHDGSYSMWRFNTFKDHLRSGGKFLGLIRMDKMKSYTYNKSVILENGRSQSVEFQQWQSVNVLTTQSANAMKMKTTN